MCKVKHAPKFYVRLATKPVMFPENFVVHTGSFYGRFQNTESKQVFWACDDFKKVNGAYSVHVLTDVEKAEGKIQIYTKDGTIYQVFGE